jgi:hypothetical protein
MSSILLRYSGIILSSGVNDEPVLQEGKSKESIGRSRSVFSTPTIPTGNQVTKSVNKPHYPKSFGNCGVIHNSKLKGENYGWNDSNGIYIWNGRGLFWNSSICSNTKTNKDLKRKRNPQRGLVQGSNDDKRNHYSHLFSHGGVEQNRELRKGEKL